MNQQINSDALAAIEVLNNDFEHYANVNLKITTKDGGLKPFKLNRSQQYMHEIIEKQRREKGYVRVIVLKCRQLGASTYTAGRNYKICTFNPGINAAVVANDKDNAEGIFDKIRTFQKHSSIQITANTDSKTKIEFDRMKSGIMVMSAGSQETGRSKTIQVLHGTEVAFWKEAKRHLKGLMQAVPGGKNIEGTEIILESTANGAVGPFYKMWNMAVAGIGLFIPIFIPWFWTDEYRLTPPSDFEQTEEELKCQKAHNLDLEQIYWRHEKIKELDGDLKAFQQEYPATPQEAFVASGDSYINVENIIAARREKRPLDNPQIERVGGLDLAFSTGGDRSVLSVRHGRIIPLQEIWPNEDDANEIAARAALAIVRHKLDHLFVDGGAGGKQVVDIIKRINGGAYADKVTAVNFGGRAFQDDRYGNKRAEMVANTQIWLADKPARIPDDDGLQTELLSYKVKRRVPTLLFRDKKETREEIGVSPDQGDSVILTFADHVEPPGSDLPPVFHHDFYEQSAGGVHGY